MVVRRMLQAGALSAAGVALAVQVVGAMSPPGVEVVEPPARSWASPPPMAAQASAASPLDPVVISNLPPGPPRPAAPAATASATQTLSLEIVGGELSVDPPSAMLDVIDGRAVVPPVTVIDARGTLDGWILCAVAPAGQRFRVVDGDVAAVDGDDRGLRAGHGASDRLATAAHGHGGGTYRFAGEVEVVGRDRPADGEITVRFEVSGGQRSC